MSSLSERSKRNQSHGRDDCLRVFSDGRAWLMSNSPAKCFILGFLATFALHLLLPNLSPFRCSCTTPTSLTRDDKENSKGVSPRLKSKTLPPADPDRVCSQNPYISALNSSMADVVAKMDSWSVEEHLARIPENPDNFEHTHARFFPFEPLAHCQSDKLDCVGGPCKHDVSKIVCGLDRVQEKGQNNRQEQEEKPPHCVIYSIGGNNKWTFELDLLRRTPCDVHTFDCTGPIDRFHKADNPRLHFHHVCLGTKHEDSAVNCVGRSKCGETWTLLEMQQRLGHSRIDLLKMDIEGFEWPIFESWPLLNDIAASEGMLLPMQVLVEIHYGRAKSAAHMVRLQARFLKMGYLVVERDDNKNCLHCTELTLIRVRCPERGVYTANA